MTSNYGRAIRIALAAANVTRSELAGAVGVTPSAVSLWTGNHRDPPIEKLSLVADALGMPQFVLHILAAPADQIGAPEGFAALSWMLRANGLQSPQKDDTIIAETMTTTDGAS